MWRVMAIRADSIWRLVTYAGSSAWMANSPKLIAVPPLALPERLGWCCLRCLTRRGISMASGPLFRSRSVLCCRVLGGGGLGRSGRLGAGHLGDRRLGSGLARGHRDGALGGGALGGVGDRTGRRLGGSPAGLGATGGRAGRAGTALGALGALTTLLTLREGLEGLPLGTRAAGIALVDPHLDADATEGGAGLVDAVVDVRAQRVQRHPALAVELRPAHLGTAEAAGALHPDALGARAQRGLHALAHRAAERHPAGQLLGDALRDELSVDLGVAHLEDVELHLLAGELLELGPDAVRLGATAADDDARPRGVDVDTDPVTRALDLDAADARPLHALRHELADRHVLLDVVAVALTRLGPGGEPTALVLRGDAEAEPVRVDLLPH